MGKDAFNTYLFSFRVDLSGATGTENFFITKSVLKHSDQQLIAVDIIEEATLTIVP